MFNHHGKRNRGQFFFFSSRASAHPRSNRTILSVEVTRNDCLVTVGLVVLHARIESACVRGCGGEGRVSCGGWLSVVWWFIWRPMWWVLGLEGALSSALKLWASRRKLVVGEGLVFHLFSTWVGAVLSSLLLVSVGGELRLLALLTSCSLAV